MVRYEDPDWLVPCPRTPVAVLVVEPDDAWPTPQGLDLCAHHFAQATASP